MRGIHKQAISLSVKRVKEQRTNSRRSGRKTATRIRSLRSCICWSTEWASAFLFELRLPCLPPHPPLNIKLNGAGSTPSTAQCHYYQGGLGLGLGPNIYRCSMSLRAVSYCTEIQCKKSFHFVSNHIRNRYNLLSDCSIRGSETLLLIFEVPPRHTYYPGFINDRTETLRWHSLGQDHRKAFNQALIMSGCGFFFFLILVYWRSCFKNEEFEDGWLRRYLPVSLSLMLPFMFAHWTTLPFPFSPASWYIWNGETRSFWRSLCTGNKEGPLWQANGGWEDGSMGEGFALQVWRSGVKFLETDVMPDAMKSICDPSASDRR